jgi:hypothetical protein
MGASVPRLCVPHRFIERNPGDSALLEQDSRVLAHLYA